jgi:hypothetical protein
MATLWENAKALFGYEIVRRPDVVKLKNTFRSPSPRRTTTTARPSSPPPATWVRTSTSTGPCGPRPSSSTSTASCPWFPTSTWPSTRSSTRPSGQRDRHRQDRPRRRARDRSGQGSDPGGVRRDPRPPRVQPQGLLHLPSMVRRRSTELPRDHRRDLPRDDQGRASRSSGTSTPARSGRSGRSSGRRSTSPASDPIPVVKVKAEYYMYNETGFNTTGSTSAGLDPADGHSGPEDRDRRHRQHHLGRDRQYRHPHPVVPPQGHQAGQRAEGRRRRDRHLPPGPGPRARVWYIDVGNLPKAKAEQYVKSMMDNHKNKLTYDVSTGRVPGPAQVHDHAGGLLASRGVRAARAPRSRPSRPVRTWAR